MTTTVDVYLRDSFSVQWREQPHMHFEYLDQELPEIENGQRAVPLFLTLNFNTNTHRDPILLRPGETLTITVR